MMARKELSNSERLDWLQLIRTNTIGPITFNQLVGKYGSAGAALDALPALFEKAGRKGVKIANRDDCQAEWDAAREIDSILLTALDDEYPVALAATPGAPPVIYAKGHMGLCEKNCVAIIGARNASLAGRRMARDLSEGLGAAGVVVVSGLARGIDGAAHTAALDTGTIAVVAGGINVIYPPEHAELTERIGEVGCIISERPPGMQPTARDFPRRNRLISGLCFGVVVVEAATRSGTLITARYALEQGREVFAVPGSPLDPRCQGANRLIREGATLIETADDIIEAMQAAPGQHHGAAEPDNNPFSWTNGLGREEPPPDLAEQVRADVFGLLSFTPIHRDQFIQEVDGPATLVLEALMMLVIEGLALEETGGLFSKNPD